MLIPRFLISTFSAAAMILGADAVSGQDYPNKPIRIVTGSVGATNDFVARRIAQGISDLLGQPMIVDNRGGVPAQIVSQSPPDGYTMYVSGNGLWITPLIQQKAPYDPVRDFAPITITSQAPNLLIVHPSVPVKSVKELIAYAKAKPGELNYSIGSVGGQSHLAAELFKSMAGINIVPVPYSSGAQETADLVGGRIQLAVTTQASVLEQARMGKLRALATTSLKPSILYPELPTVAASGLPGYESGQMIVVVAPAKTPATIIKRLNQEIVRFLKTTEVKERFSLAKLEIVGSSPEELAAQMKSDMVRLSKVIKDAGIKE